PELSCAPSVVARSKYFHPVRSLVNQTCGADRESAPYPTLPALPHSQIPLTQTRLDLLVGPHLCRTRALSSDCIGIVVVTPSSTLAKGLFLDEKFVSLAK